MAQGIGAFLVPSEDTSLIPSTSWHVTIICNTNPIRSNISFWPQKPLHSHGTLIYLQNTHIHNIKINLKHRKRFYRM